jgi:hypothetical protein
MMLLRLNTFYPLLGVFHRFPTVSEFPRNETKPFSTVTLRILEVFTGVNLRIQKNIETLFS